MRVLGYEDVVVPYGRFESAMKVEEIGWDNGDIFSGPAIVWFDKKIGFVKELDVPSGIVTELVAYSHP